MLSSHGCATCRSRRIKCDRSLPKCLKCIRSNRLCIKRDDDSSSNITPGRGRRTRIQPLLIPESTHCKEIFFQWRNGKDPWMQNAIDHVLTNFVFNAEDLSVLANSGSSSIEVFDIVLAETGPGRTVIEVLDILAHGLYTMQAASAQTIEGRREQHVKYRSAMAKLRESISLYPNSRTLVAPIFLFALYEMIMNTTSSDKTWQIHINGLLAMLQQNHSPKGEKTTSATTTNLVAARKFAESEKSGDIQEFLRSRPPMDDIEKAWLLVDISKFKLKNLITTMDRFRALSGTSIGFKKLDVEKLRASVKQIQRDLLLVRELIPKECHPARASKAHCSSATDLPPSYYGYYEEVYSNNLLCAKWNEYRAMLLITSDFLLRTAHFLYSGTSRPNSRETTALTRVVKEAVDGICASVAYYHNYSKTTNTKSSVISSPEIVEREYNDGNDNHYISMSMSTMDALALAWSLHCAIAMEQVTTEAQRDWMKVVLEYTGYRMRIPKAMALASTPSEEFTYSDVLAGLTLLGSGVLRSV